MISADCYTADAAIAADAVVELSRLNYINK